MLFGPFTPKYILGPRPGEKWEPLPRVGGLRPWLRARANSGLGSQFCATSMRPGPILRQGCGRGDPERSSVLASCPGVLL